MIDLHTHTDQSDGSWSPERLVEEAARRGIEAFAITDHDTLAGYDRAAGPARACGLDLVCGIEVSTVLVRRQGSPIKNVHVLAYFLDGSVPEDFRSWLDAIRAGRRNRNQRLADRLQSVGLDVKTEEAEALGRTVTGRPHFARLLVQKGFVASVQEAFDRFLSDSAEAFVPRRVPSLEEAAGQIHAGGGIAVLAHPARIAGEDREQLEKLVEASVEQGIQGLEVFHSDHTEADCRELRGLASAFDLAVTGGSDFHGDAKPGVELGTGLNNNLSIPREVLERLREKPT